jgi:hypothetical protein
VSNQAKPKEPPVWRDWQALPDAPNCVTVFGAGIAGLTAAHELVERGFQVQVWEPARDERRPERGCDVGGLARTQWVAADWPLERTASEMPGAIRRDSREDGTDAPFRLRGTRPITHLPAMIYVLWRPRHFKVVAPYELAERLGGKPLAPADFTKLVPTYLREQRRGEDRATTDVHVELRTHRVGALTPDERAHRVRAYVQAASGEHAYFKGARDENGTYIDADESCLAGSFSIGEVRVRFDLADLPNADSDELRVEFFDESGISTAPRIEARSQWAPDEHAISTLPEDRQRLKAIFDTARLVKPGLIYVEVASRDLRELSKDEIKARADRLLDLIELYVTPDLFAADETLSMELPGGDVRELGPDKSSARARRRALHLVYVPLDEFPYDPHETPPNLEAAISFRPRERWIPGEHGYRFFPSFYHHLFDTMKRTPILEPVAKPGFTRAQEQAAGMPRVQAQQLVPNDRTCFDNISPTASHVLALANGQRPSELSRDSIRSLEELREYIRVIFGERDAFGFGLEPRDVSRIAVKLLQFATASEPRRAEYANMSWSEFIGAADLSENAQAMIERWPRALVAMSATECDARTEWVPLIQLLLDQVRPDGYRDGTLRGPTSEIWLEPWREYLEGQGVEFIRGRLDDFEVVATNGVARVWPKVDCHDKRYFPEYRPDPPLRPGYFVIAVSTPELNRLAHKYAAAIRRGRELGLPEGLHVDTDLSRALHVGDLRPRDEQRPLTDGDFGHAVPKDFAFRHIVGVQFYFAEDLFWIDGHVYYPNTGWGLTSISQVRFWQAKVDWQYGYRGVLSVIIGDWNRVDDDPNEPKTAWDAVHQGGLAELAWRTWRQVKAAITVKRRNDARDGDDGRSGRFARRTPTGDIPEPVLWHVDTDFAGFVGRWPKKHHLESEYVPLFISPPGQFASRPGSVDPDRGYTVEHGFVLAGHHMQTFTRLPCMESANESARHAVNAIIRHRKTAADVQGQRAKHAQFHGSFCDIWSPEDREVDDLQFLRDLDAKLWKRGRPHVLEIFEVDQLAKNVLRGGIRDPLDPLRWLERTSRMYRRPPFDRKDDDQ